MNYCWNYLQGSGIQNLQGMGRERGLGKREEYTLWVDFDWSFYFRDERKCKEEEKVKSFFQYLYFYFWELDKIY